MCSPAVPLLQATPNRRPASAATASSNRRANGPRARTPVDEDLLDELDLARRDGRLGQVDLSVCRVGHGPSVESFDGRAGAGIGQPFAGTDGLRQVGLSCGVRATHSGHKGHARTDEAATSGIVLDRRGRTTDQGRAACRDNVGSNVQIRQQLAIARSWIPLLVASMIIAAGTAYLITAGQPNVYEARATVIVGQSLSGLNPDYNQLLASQRLSATYARVATTQPVLERVIDRLDLDMTPTQTTGPDRGRDVSGNRPAVSHGRCRAA